MAAAAAFIEPEVLALGPERLREWSAAEPALVAYGHYLDDLVRRAAHTRSAEVEEVLGLVCDVFSGPYAVYSALVDSDVAFVPVVPGRRRLGRGHAGVDRRAAREPRSRGAPKPPGRATPTGTSACRNALAANLASTVKQAVFSARVRRYESALAASLSRSNVPVEVFDNLIATFEANLPTWHRYWRLKRRIHGVEQLAPYDVAAPLGAVLARARLRAVRRMDLRLARAARRWRTSKPCGAGAGGALGGRLPDGRQDGRRVLRRRARDGPVHRDELRRTCVSLGTLAHELGHSMHSYLSWQTQPHVYSRYSMFVAEVASNFHQALLRAHLLEAVDDPELQLAVIEEAMANFHRYFFIMPTLARFEREIHERVEAARG